MDILDHGYVRLVETWGSDERIIEAARMSTGKGFLGWGPVPGRGCHSQFGPRENVNCAMGTRGCLEDHRGDEKLLRHLWEHKHATPFEMAGAIFEIKAPIFVFREWHRHRTQSYNEMSARYTPLPDENYIPSVERLMLRPDGKNKQAGTVSGSDTLTQEKAEEFRKQLSAHYMVGQALYDAALAGGVPKELARVHLPVGRYSRMRASANLRNWFGFLSLRMASDAQWEIRQYANAVFDVLSPVFPRSCSLFSGRAVPEVNDPAAFTAHGF